MNQKWKQESKNPNILPCLSCPKCGEPLFRVLQQGSESFLGTRSVTREFDLLGGKYVDNLNWDYDPDSTNEEDYEYDWRGMICPYCLTELPSDFRGRIESNRT